MKKMFGLAVLILISSLPALAQTRSALPQGTPPIEIGGGYAFRSYLPTPYGGPNPRIKMNGLDATVAYHVNNWITAATDFDWTRNNQGSNGTTDIYTLEAGPRFYPLGHHKLSPFGEFLVGLSNTRIYLPPSGGGPFTGTDGSFAFSVGGGIDLALTKRFAVRLAEFDYDQTRSLDFSSPPFSDRNNNYKVKVAILIRFGEK